MHPEAANRFDDLEHALAICEHVEHGRELPNVLRHGAEEYEMAGDPKEFRQQLGNFFSLRRSMLDDYKRQLASIQEGGRFAPRIIDLRIPQLAFIENR